MGLELQDAEESQDVGFAIFTAVLIAPRSLPVVYQRFGGT
jgi:hypothetical protein